MTLSDKVKKEMDQSFSYKSKLELWTSRGKGTSENDVQQIEKVGSFRPRLLIYKNDVKNITIKDGKYFWKDIEEKNGINKI